MTSIGCSTLSDQSVCFEIAGLSRAKIANADKAGKSWSLVGLKLPDLSTGSRAACESLLGNEVRHC